MHSHNSKPPRLTLTYPESRHGKTTYYSFHPQQDSGEISRIIFNTLLEYQMPTNQIKPNSNQLFLLFSKNVNLLTWKNSGYLTRENIYYQKMNQFFDKVTWITYGGKEDSDLTEEIKQVAILNNESNLSFKQYFKNITMKLKQPRSGKYVLKTNQLSSAYDAYKIHKTTDTPYVIRCGNVRNYWIHKKRFISKVVTWIQLKLSINHAKVLIVPTDEEANYAKKLLLIPSSKIKVIPNFVDTELFKPSNLPKTNKICFVGSFKRAKNLTNLVLSLADLTDIELRLIGDGPEKQKLEKLASEAGVKIEFLGVKPQDELPELLNECQCFVFPSLYEGHPKALIEAMSCALPVITTPVYGIKNIINHNINGYLCNDTSPKSIKEGIVNVLKNPKLKDLISINARKTILKEYSMKIILEKEIQLYKDLNLI